MYKLLYPLALLLFLCAFQCPRKQMGGLENNTWQLRKLVEGEVTDAIPADIVITATFKAGQLTGSGGCNSYRSTYTNTGKQVTIGAILATKMYCPANNRESRYFKALEGSQAWTISGNTLTMQGANASLVFEQP